MDIQELPEIVRKETDEGNIIYVLSDGTSYDDRGLIIKTKIEKSLVDDSNQTNNTRKETKKQQTKKQNFPNKLTRMAQNVQFYEGVHDFTSGIMDLLSEKFSGMTFGEEGATKEDMMKELFGDYKPGDKVKKVKGFKKAKSAWEEGSEKKKRKLSGYTLFGQSNKDKFNEELSKMDPKPKYITYQSEKWAELSQEEKDEWNVKAASQEE